MRFLPLLLALVFPVVASAHEMYVLPKDAISYAMTMPPLQVFEIITANTGSFFFWGFIVVWAIFTVFTISISKPFEEHLAPRLTRLKPYAPLAARVTLGIAILAAGLTGALFGPELPLSSVLPESAIPSANGLLVFAGALLIVGLFTRLISLALIGVYASMWLAHGTYMLTYTNYLGVMMLSLLVGSTHHALDCYICHLYPNFIQRIVHSLREHAFVILRIAFGISLIFASIYAKFFYAQLALETVIRYNLTNYFPFEPSFIVLGAFCIELLAGIFFILGLEVRFASLFLLFWLTLSLLYFQEAVWPHIILAGVAIAIFMHGYDKYTLQLHLMRRNGRRAKEPVF
jgi:uncharacterized membrane protein YphA (DoxX/SURF4 family)